VGNIIKCEGLFEAGIHPNSISSELTQQQLLTLVHKLCGYARHWYDCCRGVGPSRVNRKQVYGCQSCAVCQGSVTLIRDGSAQRITYYCEHCQKLPNNSCNASCKAQSDCCLASQTPWKCSFCDYENVSMNVRCEICDSQQEARSRNDHNSNQRLDVSADSAECGGGSDHHHHQQQQRQQQAYSRDHRPELTFLHPAACRCSLPQICTLQRVRKEGPTHGRLFWSCSNRKCSFFSWADGSFPKCQHGQPACLRRVLKPGPTNGKYFFSCCMSKSSQCGFFMWCDQHEHTQSAACVSTNANTSTAGYKRSFSETEQVQNPSSASASALKKAHSIVIPL
jgi:GRF zinc finger